MTADEVISKAERFAMSFTDKLKDESQTQQSRQVFFMENQDELRKYMGALQKTIEALREPSENTEEDDEDVADNQMLLSKAEEIVTNLRQAIAEFQNELMINSDVSEDDITPVVSEETIGDAMKNNKTTQNIAANMEAIAEQKKANAISYNYMLVCDGESTLIFAKDKQTLEVNINAVVDAGNYKDIRLYKVSYTPVPLKTRTILSV